MRNVSNFRVNLDLRHWTCTLDDACASSAYPFFTLNVFISVLHYWSPFHSAVQSENTHKTIILFCSSPNTSPAPFSLTFIHSKVWSNLVFRPSITCHSLQFWIANYIIQLTPQKFPLHSCPFSDSSVPLPLSNIFM